MKSTVLYELYARKFEQDGCDQANQWFSTLTSANQNILISELDKRNELYLLDSVEA